MIVTTNDSSMPFAFEYDETEWRAIVDGLPVSLATGADLDAERKGLEFVATAYLNLLHHHRIRSEKSFPTKEWKQRRKQIADDLAKAEKAGTIASNAARPRSTPRCSKCCTRPSARSIQPRRGSRRMPQRSASAPSARRCASRCRRQ